MISSLELPQLPSLNFEAHFSSDFLRSWLLTILAVKVLFASDVACFALFLFPENITTHFEFEEFSAIHSVSTDTERTKLSIRTRMPTPRTPPSLTHTKLLLSSASNELAELLAGYGVALISTITAFSGAESTGFHLIPTPAVFLTPTQPLITVMILNDMAFPLFPPFDAVGSCGLRALLSVPG